MSFITPFNTYCYLRMPEGLKNAGPMFCRMMKAILRDQIHKNVFTYVDDIVVASKKKSTQIDDLAETFANMRGAQLTQSRKVRVWCAERKGYMMSSVSKGN
jgi:sulfur relay (sulfurtransferase) complex TusBCD TusD component (DsrE family)